MKEVLKVLRDLRIETSERGNYSQSYANGYTDAISDAIQAVKKMDYIPCCKSDSELLVCKKEQRQIIIDIMKNDEELGLYEDGAN